MKPDLILRQGDVGLQRISTQPADLPADLKPVDLDGQRVILAYGEVTGHAHAIAETTKAKLWDAGAERYLQVLETTALRHEEHAPINLEPGIYRVIQQREYSPEEIRRVAD